jgi:hypothetical protein
MAFPAPFGCIPDESDQQPKVHVSSSALLLIIAKRIRDRRGHLAKVGHDHEDGHNENSPSLSPLSRADVRRRRDRKGFRDLRPWFSIPLSSQEALPEKVLLVTASEP